MDDSPEPSQNDDPSIPPPSSPVPEVVIIAAKGDILLDVTFETSRSTLKATRKANAASKPRPGQPQTPASAPAQLKSHIRLAFRVDLATLKKHSRYFTNLLGDTRFREARAVTSTLDSLVQQGVQPGEASPDRLPRVLITDDDEATQAAGREGVFADMLRILHGQRDAAPKPVTMLYVVTLAVLADRFACTAPVARYLTTGLKFKWPATPPPRLREDLGGLSGLGLAAEEVVRQKVLVGWLLDQPMRFAAATREMVIYGSHRWEAEYLAEEADHSVAYAEQDAAAARQEAIWWYLPDDLEEELHHRRTLLLRTLASIPAHFLYLYTSRTRGGLRQCKRGYDSSSACDSFQLGEMVKFLVSKNLLSLTTFSPVGDEEVIKDFAAVDVHGVLAALKQCQNYQVDRNHTNCGLRTRIMPILEYVGTMLSANVVQIPAAGWKKDRVGTSWQKRTGADGGEAGRSGGKKDFVVATSASEDSGRAPKKGQSNIFRFTRSVASDQRLRYEGAMAADRMARELFTADGWDWTPEDLDQADPAEESRHLSMPLRRKLDRA